MEGYAFFVKGILHSTDNFKHSMNRLQILLKEKSSLGSFWCFKVDLMASWGVELQKDKYINVSFLLK